MLEEVEGVGLPMGDGGEGGVVEGEGAVGGSHYATGCFQGGLCTSGYRDEQQAVAMVDGGRSAGACTGVGVEGDLRLVRVGGEESGDGTQPCCELPFHGPDALGWHGGCDNAIVASGEGDIAFHVFDGQPLDGGGGEQMGVPLLDVQSEQGVNVDAVVAFYRAVAHNRFKPQFFLPQGEHLAGREMHELIGVFHGDVF